MLAWRTVQHLECPGREETVRGIHEGGVRPGTAWVGKPNLHEGAVEKRALGGDEVGAEAAGDGLLGGLEVLLGKLQTEVQLVQVTPETGQIVALHAAC